MSLSTFEDILSLNEAPDPKKVEAETALAAAKEALDTIATVVPDDKEELREEQADWCGRWHLTLVHD